MILRVTPIARRVEYEKTAAAELNVSKAEADGPGFIERPKLCPYTAPSFSQSVHTAFHVSPTPCKT